MPNYLRQGSKATKRLMNFTHLLLSYYLTESACVVSSLSPQCLMVTVLKFLVPFGTTCDRPVLTLILRGRLKDKGPRLGQTVLIMKWYCFAHKYHRFIIWNSTWSIWEQRRASGALAGLGPLQTASIRRAGRQPPGSLLTSLSPHYLWIQAVFWHCPSGNKGQKMIKSAKNTPG